MGPGLYSDIGRRARDLLYRDYQTDQKFSLTTYTATGVAITAAGTKKNEAILGEIQSQLKNKNVTVDVKANSDSSLLTTITVDELATPGLKSILNFVIPDPKSGKIELQYLHDHAGVAAGFGLSKNPIVNVSGVLGTKTLSVGADVGFDTASGSFTKYNAGLSYNSLDFSTSLTVALEGNTTRTRRDLRAVHPWIKKKKHAGACKATNPIDRCWRCRSDWAHNRKRLARCAKGFGRRATGGFAGRFYVVTDPSDDDMINPRPGTLRHAVIQNEPLWIVFAGDMVIRLSQELIMNSYKTIDARGASVHIAHGAQITVQFVHHVIIHNLHIHDIKPAGGGLIRDSPEHFGLRTRSDGDAISIYGSSNIWIDHISMSNCADGLVDVIMGSTAITVSNCHMTHHNDVMLFGASDSYAGDALMQITVAFNHYGKGLVQRMPRCRWGFVHVVNNDYTHWLMYAVGGSSHPTIVSQGNRYIAPPNTAAREITHRDYVPESVWKTWTWRSERDLMLNGAFFVESGGRQHTSKKKYSKQELIKAKPGSFVRRLTRYSGSLNCRVGRPC